MTDRGDNDVPGLGLADALGGLRAELAAAHDKAAGTDLQFPIDKVTVELKAVVTVDVNGKAGFKIPFIHAELGGSAGRASERVQTVTLELGSPVNAKGESVRVAKETRQVKQ